MSRLIDADRMKTTHEIQMGDFNSVESIREWIDRQPTAYDVESVVSELNERMNYYLDLWSDCKDKDDPETAEMWVLKARAIHEDIETVKAGGRNE